MTSATHDQEASTATERPPQDHTILLGQRLKQARIGKGLSLEKISADIRIHADTLAALEENHREALPAEVFTRGFVKIYAQHLGMDPDEALRLHIEEQGLAASPGSPKINIQEIMSGESMAETPIGLTGTHVFIGLLLILVGLFGYWGYQSYWRSIVETGEEAAAVITPITPPSTAPETMPASETEHSAVAEETLPETSPLIPPTSEATSSDSLPPEPAPPTQPDIAPPPTGTITITPAKTKQAMLPAAVNQAPAAAAEAARPPAEAVAPTPTEASKYVLKADFVEDTWLRIQIDGQPSRQLFFQNGDSHTWEATEKMQLFVGNAGGVIFTLNGSPLPGLGPSGKTARLNIPPGQGNQ